MLTATTTEFGLLCRERSNFVAGDTEKKSCSHKQCERYMFKDVRLSSVHVTLVATKLLVRLFILTFNQYTYTYIIIRFCCITIICSDGSTVILRRVPIWIITWPRLTEYGYFSPQTRPLFIKSHAESLWAH